MVNRRRISVYRFLVLLLSVGLFFGGGSPLNAQEECISYSEVQLWVDSRTQFDFSLSDGYEIKIESLSLGIGRSENSDFNIALYQWDENDQATKIAEGVFVSGMSFVEKTLLQPARYSIMIWWDDPTNQGVIQVNLMFEEIVPGYRSVFLQGNTGFGLGHYVYVQPGLVQAEITRGESVICDLYDNNTFQVLESFSFGNSTSFDIPISTLHGYEHGQTYVLCTSSSDTSYRVRLYFEPDCQGIYQGESPTLGEVLGSD